MSTAIPTKDALELASENYKEYSIYVAAGRAYEDSNQINYSHRPQVGLGGIGVVFRDGADFVARNRDGHFHAELLVDMVNTYLPQFVRPFRAAKPEGAKIEIDVVERPVGHVKPRQTSILHELSPDVLMDRPIDTPP